MPVDEPLYPVNLVLAGRPCLVVGGGRVALTKVRGLVDAGAVVTVVAPDIDPEVAALAASAEARAYRPGEATAYRFVIAATGDPAVNQQVYDDGEAAGVWVNSADDPQRCSAILPARVRRGRLLLTVSTGGHSPAVAAWVRKRLADAYGPEYDQLIGLLSEVRSEVQARGVGTEQLDWQEALDSGILDLLRADRLDEAKERLRACLSSSSD
ncbi:MAG TPA: bifunctional precorrin-2 dehydrogenase/sirohydrochlorin ferrochelatase [Acidimicrobiales bacterium]|nr:bifunctional precorrin-2 dehydrogenase/sirohydrochlorin ferrochelatase [Acidimicrobiales bacterium]